MSRMATQPAGQINPHGGALRPPKKYTPSETTQIYTDWANHYLEKIKSKRRITNLSKDVVDGIVLADVIEAVLNQKLPDVNRKPKTPTQMVDNITACLKLLGALGIPLEGVTALDIHQGNLKSILVIFFALSRHKQQQKLMQQREHAVSPIERALSASLAKTTSPRFPGTPSRVQHGPTQLRPPSSTATSAASSRSTSPSLGNASGIGSLIPRSAPKSVSAIPAKATSIKTPVAFASHKLGEKKLVKPSENSHYAVSNMPMVNESNDEGLTTLAVFDHQSAQSIQSNQTVQSIPIKAGLKEKSIKTKSSSGTKNSPKLASKVKREQENRLKFPESNIKPFNSGSGIPKPMAAVKGTAKTIPKPEQTDIAARERTPGDGKEVSETCPSAASPVDPEKPAPLAAQCDEGGSSCQETNVEANAEGRLAPSAVDEDSSKAHAGKQTENDDEESVNVQPMVPLFAPDESLKRIPRLSGNFSSAKRATNFSDTLDGYMSESGASLYARKAARFAISQRNRDCDSLDDSSSLSSANADPWNEMYALLKVNDADKHEPLYAGYSQANIRNGARPTGADVPPFKDFIDPQKSSAPKEAQYKVNGQEDVYSVPSYDDRKLTSGASKRVQGSLPTPSVTKVTAIPTSEKPVSKLKTAKVAAVPKLSDRRPDAAQLARSRADKPKTRLKVSGGTQTELNESQRYVKSSSRSKSPTSSSRALHSDSEYQSIDSAKMLTYHPAMNGESKLPFKSFSLTSPIANQLSQNVRERLIANGAQNYSRSDKTSGEKFAAHLFAGILEPHNKSNVPEEPTYAEARRNNGFRVEDNDTPYTSYWNKYNPKNGNDHKSDVESVDSGPVMAAPWYMNNARLNRSSSVRSTKSEDTYSPIMQQKELQVEPIVNPNDEIIYQRGRSRSSFGTPNQKLGRKEEDYRGSSVSLFSTASSLYSTQEEQQASEIRKLRRELAEAQEKIQTLSGQLSTNAHVVAAFEQSLASMTSRLQTLTVASEQKDHELQELRTFLDRMRRKEADASLLMTKLEQHRPLTRQGSDDSVSSTTSLSTNLGRPETPSNDLPSSCSTVPSPSMKKKSWLRSSFTKAFSRSKRPSSGNVRQPNEPDSDDSCASSAPNGVAWSAPSSPMLPSYHQMRHQADADKAPSSQPETVQELKKQLREKDMILTDIRLEALSSAHQLEALKETLFQMRSEMLGLKKDNERLQKQITAHQSRTTSPLNGCHSSPAPSEDASSIIDQLLSKEEEGSTSVPIYLKIASENEKLPNNSKSWMIGYASLNETSDWNSLDRIAVKMFNNYLKALDPQAHLGLDDSCLSCYRIGTRTRSLNEMQAESDSPIMLLSDSEHSIVLLLKPDSIASLVLDTLVPLQEVSSHLEQLIQGRRILIAGPSGSGKSYYASRLADKAVNLNVDKKSRCVTLRVEPERIKETRQYFIQMCDSAAAGRAFDIPEVIVLEDVHQLKSGKEVSALISCFCSWNSNSQPPMLVLTSVTSPELVDHLEDALNFRTISFASDCEPVKGFLRRFLKKRLLEYEFATKTRDREVERVFDWLPDCLGHLNAFLESQGITNAQIGHRLLLQAPTDLTCSHVWFVDLWNYTLGPYLLNALKDSHNQDAAKWQDPTEWIVATSPWNKFTFEKLLRLRAEEFDFS